MAETSKPAFRDVLKAEAVREAEQNAWDHAAKLASRSAEEAGHKAATEAYYRDNLIGRFWHFWFDRRMFTFWMTADADDWYYKAYDAAYKAVFDELMIKWGFPTERPGKFVP